MVDKLWNNPSSVSLDMDPKASSIRCAWGPCRPIPCVARSLMRVAHLTQHRKVNLAARVLCVVHYMLASPDEESGRQLGGFGESFWGGGPSYAEL